MYFFFLKQKSMKQEEKGPDSFAFHKKTNVVIVFTLSILNLMGLL